MLDVCRYIGQSVLQVSRWQTLIILSTGISPADAFALPNTGKIMPILKSLVANNSPSCVVQMTITFLTILFKIDASFF